MGNPINTTNYLSRKRKQKLEHYTPNKQYESLLWWLHKIKQEN